MRVSKAPVFLVMCLGFAGVSGTVRPAWGDPPERTAWVTQDFIDERIDVDAQYALMRMCRSEDKSAAADATSILWAIIEDGSLAGIYQVNRGVPAKRARELGTWYWLLIPEGKNAKCVEGKGDAAPMIVYRQSIASFREHLDPALREAWKACGLPAKDPLPCTIAVRLPTVSFGDCPREEQDKFVKTYNDCWQTVSASLTIEESASCEKVCKGSENLWECIKARPECNAAELKMRHCREYASKHSACKTD